MRRRKKQNVRWNQEEINFLVENIESLGIENVAEILMKPIISVASKAKLLGFDVENKPHDWYLRTPFRATEKFISGWQIVYGVEPVCADCHVNLNVGDFVCWVGSRDKKRLVCQKCGEKEAVKVG